MKTNLMKYLFAVTFAAASINATPNLKPQMPMPSVINPVSIPAQTPIPNAADSIAATKNEQNAPRDLSSLYAFSPALLAAGHIMLDPKSRNGIVEAITGIPFLLPLTVLSFIVGIKVCLIEKQRCEFQKIIYKLQAELRRNDILIRQQMEESIEKLKAEQKSIAEDKKTA